MNVAPYHTDRSERSEQERAVYHVDDACPLGRKFYASKERVEGTGRHRERCPLCK